MDKIVERFRYTLHQTARGALADAETHERIYLLKNVSELKLTYQIRLLAFRAVQEKRKLVLRVPRHCKFDPPLRVFAKELRRVIVIEKV